MFGMCMCTIGCQINGRSPPDIPSIFFVTGARFCRATRLTHGIVHNCSHYCFATAYGPPPPSASYCAVPRLHKNMLWGARYGMTSYSLRYILHFGRYCRKMLAKKLITTYGPQILRLLRIGRTAGSSLQVEGGSFLFLAVIQSGVFVLMLSGKSGRAPQVLNPMRDK